MKKALLVLVCFALTACGSPSTDRPGTPSPQAANPVPEVTMTCDGETTKLDSTVVEAKADGVHVTIVNASGMDLSYTVSLRSGGGFGAGAPRMEKTLVLSLPPGDLAIGCDPRSEGDPSAGLPTLRVIDPEGYYLPKELECTSETASGSSIDYAEDATGDKRNPIEIVAERFEDELAPEDEVVRAGYPDEGGDPTIAIRREGRTVVAVHLFGNDKEGYLIDSEDICGDFRP